MRYLIKNGFSLLELLVAMLIFMVIIIGVLGLFMDITKIRQRTELLMAMQQNARFAITTIGNKILTAGYQGPLDIAMIPDPRCDQPGNIPDYCSIAERVPETDGIVVFASAEDRRFMKPFIIAGDKSCDDSGVVCNNPADCISNGSTAKVCTPTGLSDNSLANQTIMACGPVNSSNDPNCDWTVPNPASPMFLTECSLGAAYLCCAARKVQSGPNCSPGCARDANTGICQGSTSCYEEIAITGQFPDFLDVPARCQFLPPLHAIHYQIHEKSPNSRYLMARVNNGEWQAVASNIVDMQICYILDSACDPAQQCRRWQWGAGTFTCADSGFPAAVRNIRRVMVQITARSSRPILQSVRISENPPCIAAPPEPPPVDSNSPSQWRQYTLCSTITARNLAFIEVLPTTW